LKYRTTQGITCKEKKRLSDITVQQQQEIRRMAAARITKKRISQLTDIPYNFVRKLTKDISFHKMIPFNLQKQIAEGWKNGKSKQQIAEELNVSHYIVTKYSEYKGPPLYRRDADVPPDIINEVKRRVQEGIPKHQIAIDMRLSREKVKRFTKELAIGHPINYTRKSRLSFETIEEIRKEVRRTKTKMEVSRKLNIDPRRVYEHTHDILIRDPHNPGLSGNPLTFLQEIIENGYAKPSMRNTYEYYKKIKRKFPNIRRVSMYGDVIYFIQENPDIAMRVFLEKVNKKIYNYTILKQITDVFQGHISKKEKKKYIHK